MIAQVILTTFLLGILLYALTEYRRSPAVGLTAVLAAVGGLYSSGFLHTQLALQNSSASAAVSPHYLYLDRDQSLLLLNLHLKLRAHMELITVLARDLPSRTPARTD